MLTKLRPTLALPGATERTQASGLWSWHYHSLDQWYQATHVLILSKPGFPHLQNEVLNLQIRGWWGLNEIDYVKVLGQGRHSANGNSCYYFKWWCTYLEGEPSSCRRKPANETKENWLHSILSIISFSRKDSTPQALCMVAPLAHFIFCLIKKDWEWDQECTERIDNHFGYKFKKMKCQSMFICFHFDFFLL